MKTTPFSLVYGCEAILPLEIQIWSLWVVLDTEMVKEEKHWWWLQKLEMLDKKCLKAQ